MSKTTRSVLESLALAVMLVTFVTAVCWAMSSGRVVRDIQGDQFYSVLKVVQDNTDEEMSRYRVTVVDPDGRTRERWLAGIVHVIQQERRSGMMLVDLGLRYTRSDKSVSDKRYDLHVRSMADIQVISAPVKKPRITRKGR